MPQSQPTLGFVLHDVARFLRKRFEQHARGLGLTRSQWQVLAFLNANDGIHQGGLAEVLDIEPITLTRLLDPLEKRGLIQRQRHPTDRRMWLLRIAPEAQPLLARMRSLGEATRAEALAGISSPDRERLMAMLIQMKKNLVAACEQPALSEETVDG